MMNWLKWFLFPNRGGRNRQQCWQFMDCAAYTERGCAHQRPGACPSRPIER